MGNFSRNNTFDALKHYVGVRLQQGVPIVDADWNELEDIRRFELRAFLKWFVGDGVPQGNDGFRIFPVTGHIILTARKRDIAINLEQSRAAFILGFDEGNCQASRYLPASVQLIGRRPLANVSIPQDLLVGTTLVIRTRNSASEEWAEGRITFEQSHLGDGETVNLHKMTQAITSAMQNVTVTATVGAENELGITGGNSVAPGRCLVDGWDVINESSLCYTAQQLYENDELADTWGVAVLPKLTPSDDRDDTVYLDVWEREVRAHDDTSLYIPGTNIETCVRLKREWVVRGRPGECAPLPGDADYQPGHSYYALARLTRVAGATDRDLRRTGLAVLSDAITINNGNVGIGTPSPMKTLDVNGDINVTGDVTITGKVADRDVAADGAMLDRHDAEKLNGRFIKESVITDSEGVSDRISVTNQDIVGKLVSIRGWVSTTGELDPPAGTSTKWSPPSKLREVWAITTQDSNLFKNLVSFEESGKTIRLDLHLGQKGIAFSFNAPPDTAFSYAFQFVWEQRDERKADFIVVYDKTATGNPIVAIHAQPFPKAAIELRDIHMEDKPEERGMVVVPGEIIARMVVREYRRDRKGNIVQRPVLREETKTLSSVWDSALGQHILMFGGSITEIVSITDLGEQPVDGTLINADRGIIGLGERSGYFTVICRIATGMLEPEVIAERQNWQWIRDQDGQITGMALLQLEG